MRKKTSKKGVLMFFAVFMVTGAVILGLSFATRINPAIKTNPTVTQASSQVQAPDTTPLSATLHQEEKSSLPAVGAFLLLAAIPAGYVCFLLVLRNKGWDKRHKDGRKYRPQSEITFKKLAANTSSFR